VQTAGMAVVILALAMVLRRPLATMAVIETPSPESP